METHVVETLKALFDLGGVVVVTVMLYLVWKRLCEVTDRLFDLAQELRLALLRQDEGVTSINP